MSGASSAARFPRHRHFSAAGGSAIRGCDIALDAYRGWPDEERMIVNVHTLYREFSGNQAEPDAGELHGRMLRWRQARRGKQ